MRIDIDESQLNKVLAALEESFADVVGALDSEFIAVISDPNEFSDLGFTEQDIIDTGRFKDSQVVSETRDDGNVQVRWSWSPTSPENGYKYAPALHFGYNAWGKKWIPGRPWTTRAVRRINPVQRFEDGVRRRI